MGNGTPVKECARILALSFGQLQQQGGCTLCPLPFQAFPLQQKTQNLLELRYTVHGDSLYAMLK